jgi:hypothetical protein
MIWLFFLLSSSAQSFTREEACLTLAEKLVELKTSEIQTHLSNTPDLEKESFISKFIQEKFTYCLERITNPEAFFFKNEKIPRLEYIGHLIKEGMPSSVSQDLPQQVTLSEKIRKKSEL